MKFVIRVLLVFFAFSFLTAFGQEDKDWLLKADKYFQAGEKEKAKEYYLKAAELGSAEAHFAIAYKFIVTKEESIFHYSEAAKRGHAEALQYALDALLFRANSLTLADPQKALELYELAKKRNPSIELIDEEDQLDVIKKCAEAGPFDAAAFIRTYHLQIDAGFEERFYSVWELAEEASRGGRFGRPDPKLAFQLIIRGGCVPTELILAVTDYYEAWKSGTAKEFDICDHVTSGLGQTYCSELARGEADDAYQTELRSIIGAVDRRAKAFVEPASAAAAEFIVAKAEREEKHGGSGVGAWVNESIIEQRAQFLSTVQKISGGYRPPNVDDPAVSDRTLNETYRSVIEKLKVTPIVGTNFIGVDAEGVREVQRLWIPYRDRCAALFARLSPGTTEAFWKSWLTQIRIRELKKIVKEE
jgi:tetratricopeptide (TPR) repeat protein